MSTVLGAAATDVGAVRTHNEDSYLVDPDGGFFAVADGMGGHAAGEVASAIAVDVVEKAWSDPTMAAQVRAFSARGDADARKNFIKRVRDGVLAAHMAIVDKSQSDPDKHGMGTTFSGLLIAGGEAIFAHAGDSRVYLIRDNIPLQLSEDHTILARLRAAGIEAGGGDDDMPEPNRWKGVLTNALGMGDARVSTFVVPLYSGDRFVLCSDGVYEYFDEAEIGRMVTGSASPARAAQSLVRTAVERGGEDNATAVVVKVVEAGESTPPPHVRDADDRALAACPLLATLSVQERLRALRVATPRELKAGREVAAVALEDRVAYIVLDGEVTVGSETRGPGRLIFPEALVADAAVVDPDPVVASDARFLMIRRNDFFELTDEEPDLGVKLYGVLATLMAR